MDTVDNLKYYSVLDDHTAEAMFRYLDSEQCLWNEFCSATLNDYSIAEWIIEFHLSDFGNFCVQEFGFGLIECL